MNLKSAPGGALAIAWPFHSPLLSSFAFSLFRGPSPFHHILIVYQRLARIVQVLVSLVSSFFARGNWTGPLDKCSIPFSSSSEQLHGLHSARDDNFRRKANFRVRDRTLFLRFLMAYSRPRIASAIRARHITSQDRSIDKSYFSFARYSKSSLTRSKEYPPKYGFWYFAF